MNELMRSIEAITPELIQTRRYLHAHPELAGEEAGTAAYVADRLSRLSLDTIRTGVGGHGIIAEIRGEKPGPLIALRADMDALPIHEENSADHCSSRPGVMHACGHDGHTSILLGVATILSERRAEIKGTVRLIFQPAEENVTGAIAMCADGAMDGVESIFGLHGWPDMAVGQIGVKRGPMMAGVDDFDIEVIGKGSHAAYPHRGIDPVPIAARIVDALQTLVSRETDPFDQAVVTVTQFHAGTTYNVIPATAKLSGTIRTLSGELRERLPRRVREISEGICDAAAATVKVSFIKGSPPVINDENATQLAREAASRVIGERNVIELTNASMGAEDFAVYLSYAPGCFFRLGLGDVSNLHSSTFDFTDAALPMGVAVFCSLVLG